MARPHAERRGERDEMAASRPKRRQAAALQRLPHGSYGRMATSRSRSSVTFGSFPAAFTV